MLKPISKCLKQRGGNECAVRGSAQYATPSHTRKKIPATDIIKVRTLLASGGAKAARENPKQARKLITAQISDMIESGLMV